ncbi:uncharacterized protein LOC120263836 [Dioscorea cayenensis subsp. rotundata]|uniref:Uncharacterized protein LOC120263836 n=1 Tax=Dioscorea cayennensis subsp. rotundata TaxID=55577 RepID=A0AB40BK22_DIOCR|nr:uncharacterized protein LOC120263836 [Dioscorea cayenensis subsp. rotundata]
MPSYTPPTTTTTTTTTTKPDLQTLISTSLPFLHNDLPSIHPSLPSLISTLISSGAADCWHKHSTFFSHLLSVHRILSLWSSSSSSSPLPLAGLFHSAYSNSYVNLAIFPPTSSSRATLTSLLTPSVERLVHLFCVIPRHLLIHDLLLSHFPSDDDLRHHLLLSLDPSQLSWRLKIQSFLPSQGLTLKHIRTGEDVHLSRRVIAAFLLMTMADFSDQLFSFQDQLFNNDNGRLEFSGNNFTSLWPGDGKPGLWMNSISRMGALFRLIVREEEVFIEERRRAGGVEVDKERDEDLELVIPPVFESCTEVLGTEEQKEGRELYWEAVCSGSGGEKEEKLLKKSCEKNPFVGEPHIVLGQVCLGLGKYEEAEKEVEKGLRLVLEWGSSWDKRIGWEGWVAWGRVLLMKAKEKDWPNTSWGILNLGLVR